MSPQFPIRLSVRSKIWLIDDTGDVVFGLGRLKILEAVQREGSLQAAAKTLGMSYRAVWARIKATESRLGQPLLIRSIGGKSGGGSRLTPYALDLMNGFRNLHRTIAEESDKRLDEWTGSHHRSD